DAICGNYLLTKDMTVPREEAIDLMASVGIEEFSSLPNKAQVTGKEIFSAMLPDDYNFDGNSKSMPPDHPDHIVKIRKGKLLSGVMDKSTLGEGSGLLLRNIHKRYGRDEMVEILGRIYRLGNEVLLRYGFTTRLSDADLSSDATIQIDAIIDDSYVHVQKLIEQFKNGTLELLPGRLISETLELRILERLNKARNDTGQIVADTSDQTSNTMAMVKSGARGNLINLAQIAACVGQQALRGGRIGKGYNGRTLSCFRKNDLGPEARGFIKNGFKKGLRPHEMFFMAMTGRDSLMDTALRTPKSGYLYRRLANALQDFKVEYDFTVRDASGKIVQFAYGEDGIDVSKSEGGKINVKQIINSIE
ncbi:DNA-directed RNA polymerase subunit A', partial [archaeon]|nr:DNA-directed RNA polymerase subunit A' [archaeon]